jgi:hypothetical protein
MRTKTGKMHFIYRDPSANNKKQPFRWKRSLHAFFRTFRSQKVVNFIGLAIKIVEFIAFVDSKNCFDFYCIAFLAESLNCIFFAPSDSRSVGGINGFSVDNKVLL